MIVVPVFDPLYGILQTGTTGYQDRVGAASNDCVVVRSEVKP